MRTEATAADRPFLKVEGLGKTFPGMDEPVFDQVNFDIGKGEFVCIIGHSGCGKSTILNVLAGLDKASQGHVFMDSREVAGPSLERGVVFQSHALFPWLSVRRNIAFAVRSRWPDWPAAQVDAQVQRYVDLVGLGGAIERKPAELSGGMKQRVGIARAFAIEPRMLLLDEPFGALDALTRGAIQDELLRICGQTHQTVFMITHDVDEAILLADRILLMSNGPQARIAEIVRNTMPRNRQRASLHHDPQYYRIRNHLIDFLVLRSRELSHGKAASLPPVVAPGLGQESGQEPGPQAAASSGSPAVPEGAARAAPALVVVGNVGETAAQEVPPSSVHPQPVTRSRA